MSTYYSLGIIKNFTATSKQALSHEEWKEQLNERVDTQQYTLKFGDTSVQGKLKPEVFENNIEDLYKKLVSITDNKHLLQWFNNKGTDMNQYQSWTTEMTYKHHDQHVDLIADLALLFTEGKVLVEEFNTEPMLINWLFRHTNLSNQLAGCVMSDIVG